jgi:adenylate cyclase
MLVRRSARGAAAAPARATIDGIEDWLLGEALRLDDLLLLFEALAWRLVAAGLPLDRASLHVGTLHPQVFGLQMLWRRADGLCDEATVAERALRNDAYLRSPLRRAIEHGESIRARTDDPAMAERFPLIAELAGQGITDYMITPLGGGGSYHNAVTAATGHPAGFDDSQVAALRAVLRLFALHVERHIVLRIAANVLDTYLGHAAGAKVLAGSIKRGAGEAIQAIIWMSDLRGFTDLMDRLAGPDVIAVLNAYLERLAGAVLDRGGEVLKFIGDGLLAVFPLSGFATAAAAAGAALAAAEEALVAVERLNADPPAPLAGIAGWRPLRTGIALHGGEVFFGNVGAAERLDFTVIGGAVNLASRVEALSKPLGRAILLTGPVADLVDVPLDALGRHNLRGVGEPVALFSPAPPERGAETARSR